MNIIINLCGIGAMVSLFLIYQQKSRKRMIICKLSADIFWIFHYFLLGAYAGMIPNFVGVFREIVFVNRKEKRWANSVLWCFLFIAFNLTLGIRTYSEWYDLLPIIASSFVTISLWLDNPDLTKLITLPVAGAFLTYNIFVSSYIGIINESISILSIIFYFTKKFIKNKGEKS